VKVTALVPVLYREEQLADTLERLSAVRDRVDLEVLVLVDVPDPAREAETRAENDAVAAAHDARPVYRIGQRGFGSALRRGFEEAGGDAVVPFMADRSDDPETIPAMVEAMERGLDVVAGSRYIPGGGIVGNTAKQRASKWYSRFLRLAGGPPIHDASNAFKLYRREVLRAVRTEAESFDLSVELTVKAHLAGFRVGEVPSVWTNRQVGSSNFNVPREVRNYRRWLWLAARSPRPRPAAAPRAREAR
jgi:glycosyltransferase involved in cell wall biosynthesis